MLLTPSILLLKKTTLGLPRYQKSSHSVELPRSSSEIKGLHGKMTKKNYYIKITYIDKENTCFKLAHLLWEFSLPLMTKQYLLKGSSLQKYDT